MPLSHLPSLAEFPEDKEDKELTPKQEKKQVSEKQFFHVQDMVSKKGLKTNSKLSWKKKETSYFLSESYWRYP